MLDMGGGSFGVPGILCSQPSTSEPHTAAICAGRSLRSEYPRPQLRVGRDPEYLNRFASPLRRAPGIRTQIRCGQESSRVAWPIDIRVKESVVQLPSAKDLGPNIFVDSSDPAGSGVLVENANRALEHLTKARSSV